MRRDWSVRSLDMSTIWTCLWHFWTEGPIHYNGIKKPQAFQAVLHEISRLSPQHQNAIIILSTRNRRQSLFAADCGHTNYWGHSHLQNVMFKAIKWISCDIQRKSFENFHVIQVFMREYPVDIFAKNDFDPWVTWHCATTKVLVLAN